MITAGHCLPSLPPCCASSFVEERTYRPLLGPLDAEPTAGAECLFVDPIADLAVLGAPDGQMLPEEKEHYETLTGAMTPLRIARIEEGEDAPLSSCRSVSNGLPVT